MAVHGGSSAAQKCFLFRPLPLRVPDCSEPVVPWTLLEPRELGVFGLAKYCLVPALPEMVIGLIDMGDSGPSRSVWLARLGGTSKVLTLNLGSHPAITQDYGVPTGQTETIEENDTKWRTIPKEQG